MERSAARSRTISRLPASSSSTARSATEAARPCPRFCRFGGAVDAGARRKVANAFLHEYFLVAGEIDEVFEAIAAEDQAALATLAAEGAAAALEAIGDVLLRAALDGLIATWEGFNPSLVIHGAVQPTIFGFPMGEPTDEVDLIINKQQVSFGIRTSLIRTMKNQAKQFTGGVAAAPLVDLLTLGFEDRMGVAFALNLPYDDIVSGLLTAGETILGDDGQPLAVGVDLVDTLLDAINPFANWSVKLEGDMTWLGFRVAGVSGIFFGPHTLDAQERPIEDDARFDVDRRSRSAFQSIPRHAGA